MDTRERIIDALLEEASKNGLGKVSLNQIAKNVGIKKASIYYYFKSKDELISQMYEECRNKACESLTFDFNKPYKEIVFDSFMNYISLCNNKKMKQIFLLIESEKFNDKKATNLYEEETERMINKSLNLFKYFEEYKNIKFKNIQFAATAYALFAHELIILATLENKVDEEKIKGYIDNFFEVFTIEKKEQLYE